ncbi:GMC oxidoreductase [Stipitochalara longipes BDJ]|nr:GMC oxidoreductase [Stipitochalara longipes BDJ]
MEHPVRKQNTDSNRFDYVIVGGGSAGLVLAARLTENPAVQVVVLEAGEKRLDDPNINIPGLMTELYGDEEYDWRFKTAPQPSLNNRTIAWPRGKVLGGSSAINFLMVSHASRADLDNWEKLGNPGWNFDALQPYYRKSETFNAPNAETVEELGTAIIDVSLHGSSGPIQTSFPKGQGPLDQAWSRAFKTLGLGPQSDPRAGSTLGGYSLPKFMDKTAKRSYAAPAYYVPSSGRPNLTVWTGAFVKKIAFDTNTSPITATGVWYTIDGREKFVGALREVILSAGTVKSPQILELSGIGNKWELKKVGIDVIIENDGVGENLQDHPLVGFAYEALEGIPTREMIKQPGVLDWALQEYTQKGAGPLAGGATGTGFLSYSSILPQEQKESFGSHLAKLVDDYSNSSTDGLRKQLKVQKETLLDDREADIQYTFGASGASYEAGESTAAFFDHNDPGGYAGIMTILTHAFSRGSVHIQSSDASTPPIIDPRYMTNPVDVEILSSGLLFTQNISEAAPMSNLLRNNEAGDGKKTQPSFKVSGRLTKEIAVRIVREAMSSSFHPVGTCSMLPREDGGVVDPSLRVYGTSNLRVVDASFFPLNVRGNIGSLVYAVAERASDLIKSERKQ